MNAEEVLQKLRELKPELTKRYKVREMSLFGSWVQGEQSENSDIDLLVEFEPGADLLDLVALSLYLEGIFRRPVDVVPRKALREELRSRVLKQAVSV